mmetsp:Transcript_4886/g.12597  ORF Transcript_4886/g.12597 Transcript_4886/m.12597 type:complete len:222 (+) Transcript_4886:1395-2060(+)
MAAQHLLARCSSTRSLGARSARCKCARRTWSASLPRLQRCTKCCTARSTCVGDDRCCRPRSKAFTAACTMEWFRRISSKTFSPLTRTCCQSLLTTSRICTKCGVRPPRRVMPTSRPTNRRPRAAALTMSTTFCRSCRRHSTLSALAGRWDRLQAPSRSELALAPGVCRWLCRAAFRLRGGGPRARGGWRRCNPAFSGRPFHPSRAGRSRQARCRTPRSAEI